MSLKRVIVLFFSVGVPAVWGLVAGENAGWWSSDVTFLATCGLTLVFTVLALKALPEDWHTPQRAGRGRAEQR